MKERINSLEKRFDNRPKDTVKMIERINYDLFLIAFLLYLLLLCFETVKPGMVSMFFNMNILLYVVIASGLILVLVNDFEPESGTRQDQYRYSWISLAMIIGLLIIADCLIILTVFTLGTVIIALCVGWAFAMILLLSVLFRFTKEPDMETKGNLQDD